MPDGSNPSRPRPTLARRCYSFHGPDLDGGRMMPRESSVDCPQGEVFRARVAEDYHGLELLLGVAVLVAAAILKLADCCRRNRRNQHRQLGIGAAGNWGIGASALFLCSLASAQLVVRGQK